MKGCLADTLYDLYLFTLIVRIVNRYFKNTEENFVGDSDFLDSRQIRFIGL